MLFEPVERCLDLKVKHADKSTQRDNVAYYIDLQIRFINFEMNLMPCHPLFVFS